MGVKVTIFILVFIYYLFLRSSSNKEKAKNKLAGFTCLLFALQSGLRHVIVGPDTYGYYYSFINSTKSSWAETVSGLFISSDEIRDPAFSIVEKAFSTIIPSWQLFLLALAVFYYIGMGRLWKRYIHSMEGVLLASLLVLSLFSIISLSGIRQQITMSLSMLLIPYVEDKKWKVVIPVVLVGSLIHISFLFFLAFIPLQYVKKNNYRGLIILSVLLIPIIALGARGIVAFMASSLDNEYYMGYATGVSDEKPYVYIALCSIISIFLLLNFKYLKEAPRFFLSAVILMTITFPLIILNGSLIRIGQYFTIYIMLSLSFVLDFKRDRNTYYTLMMLVLLFYIVIIPSEYHFFWEQIPGWDFIPFGIR